MRLGLLVVLVGVLYLFRNTGIIMPVEWHILWPLIVILIGIAMVFRRRWHKGCCGGCYGHSWSPQDGKTCDCNCESCNDCHGK